MLPTRFTQRSHLSAENNMIRIMHPEKMQFQKN